MIRLPDYDLPAMTQAYLDTRQSELDAITSYAEQVKSAETRWKSKDKKHFDTIRRILGKMTLVGRCHYCEDATAHEVEHFRPKSLYPEHTFLWPNYLFACDLCNNGHKKAKFAIFDTLGQFCDITRGWKAPVVPSPSGDPALIDPRTENPMEYLELDLMGSFYFLPLADAGTPNHLKAEFTITTLGLNRDTLCVIRKIAYKNYRARMKEYVSEKQTGASAQTLHDLREQLWIEPHTTVLREMVRNLACLPDLVSLFAEAPELGQKHDDRW